MVGASRTRVGADRVELRDTARAGRERTQAAHRHLFQQIGRLL